MQASLRNFDLEIQSIPEKGCALIGQIRESLESHQWPANDVFKIHLALEEAVMNAIKHGNNSDPSKSVKILCNIREELFEVVITDEGSGFIREDIPDPTEGDNIYRDCGRGLKIIENFMSSVEYQGTGNIVRMTKERTKE